MPTTSPPNKIVPRPRPDLARLRPCPHGAIGPAELAARGVGFASIIDFSVSSNPLGPSPRVAEAIATACARGAIDRYPDDDAGELRRALAARASLSVEHVLVGNGSSELIWLVALAYLRPGDQSLILGPAFGEYARACQVMGTAAIALDAAPKDGTEPRFQPGFRVDVSDAARLLAEARPRLAFVGSPNNPTGAYLTRAELIALLAASPSTLFVVDEAYRAFVEYAWQTTDLLATHPNLLLLRSLTKDYALAGLRLGYVAGSTEIINALRAVRPPWSVNALAQVAGLAALGDEEHLARSRAEVFAAKAELVAGLTSLGYLVHGGAANFVLVNVASVGLARESGASAASAFREALLARGCCVRDCGSFGLPDYIRIGVRARADCARLLAKMRQLRELPVPRLTVRKLSDIGEGGAIG